MSRWADQLQQHGTTKNLTTLVQRLETFQLPDNADQNAAAELARFKKVITYINAVMSSVDPDLVSMQALNEMQGPLQNANNEFNNFSNNKNFTHIQQANNHIDNALNVISRTFIFYQKPSKASLVNIIDTYQTTIDQHLGNLKTKADQALTDLDKRISAGKTEAEAVKAEIQAAKNEIKNVKNQAQTQVTEFSTQFSNAQTAHKASFDDFLKKKDEKVDKEFEALTKKSSTIISILEKLKDEAELVFGVVQSTVQAGAHKRYADEERSTANFHRRAAVFLMFAAVAVIILPEAKFIFSPETHQFDWGKLLERLPISVILFAPAFYLARESTKHRQNEFHNRRQELVLRTVDPYLALIKDDKKRDEIKGRIAENVFSDKPNVTDGADTEGVLAQVSNLIKQLKK